MNRLEIREIFLETAISMDYMPLVLAFIENGAAALGLQKRERGQLVLGAEEIFSYLCRLGTHHERVQFQMLDGGYYLKTTLLIADREIPWEAFNLTLPVFKGDEQELDEIGLLLAARFLDGLEVEKQAPAGIALHLIKDKDYPPAPEAVLPPGVPEGPFQAGEADREGLKQLCAVAAANYPSEVIPAFCRTPGRLVDMVAGGDYEAELARDRQGEVCGGIVWHAVSRQLVEFYGPFVMPGAAAASDLLVEKCLARVARTSALAIYSRSVPGDLPGAYFEEMSRRELPGPDGVMRETISMFRLLCEDQGSSSWIHPVLKPFVTERYQRLCLPRRLHLAENLGEQVQQHSAFLSRLDQMARSAVIKPLHTGQDAEKVLASYVQVLSSNDFREIQFELDLGEALHAELGAALAACGFEPVHVLPYGGKGDLLVFYYEPQPAGL